MSATGVIGVDVVVKIGSGATTAILGQRGAKLNSTREKIDMTTKTDWPNKVYKYGWLDGSIDCDGLLYAGGTGGIASLINTQIDGTTVDVEFTVGDTGETFTGQALMTDVSADAPQTGEGTVTCKLEKTGAWVATEGA